MAQWEMGIYLARMTMTKMTTTIMIMQQHLGDDNNIWDEIANFMAYIKLIRSDSI